MRRALALALLLIVGAPLVLGACGGGEEAATTTASGDASLEAIEVAATEFAFEPMELSLAEAGTYRFVLKNDGGAPHALAIEGNGVDAATDTIDGGETAEVDVALEEAEYEIYCPVGDHADQGMVGRIVVGARAGGATTDETETRSDDSSGPGY